MDLTPEQLKVLIAQAKNVAEAAHRGQTRKDGKTPYFKHVQSVADAVEDRLKPIAYLHDVVEDTPITLDELRQAGFPEYVLEAVDLLTHKNREPSVHYWGKIAKNKDASIVKIEDMKVNLRDDPNPRQIEKYMRGLNLFTRAGYAIS
jgi:(p)ppGpp synthase/HD superfamily hydrolase